MSPSMTVDKVLERANNSAAAPSNSSLKTHSSILDAEADDATELLPIATSRSKRLRVAKDNSGK